MASKDEWTQVIRDVAIAFIIVFIIIISLYAYTRNWPPMVVIESNSMMHGSNSEIGVIDQGDLVLVKNTNNRNDIITYSEGKKINHKTYGHYGDVIVYYKNGYTLDTPVIHRAIVWVENNKTNPGRFDVPEWDIYNVKKINYDINDIHVHLKNFEPTNSGFLTKGDNPKTNPEIDQVTHRDFKGDKVKPVRPDWVIGKGRGELPWFGLIKLKLTGNENIKDAPGNSWVNLGISIALIIGIPLSIDTIYMIYLKNKDDEDDKKSTNKGKKDSFTTKIKKTFGSDDNNEVKSKRKRS